MNDHIPSSDSGEKALVSSPHIFHGSRMTEAPKNLASETFRDIRPSLPLRPVFERCEKTAPLEVPVDAVIDLPRVKWLANGRAAIAHAAKFAHHPTGTRALIPAYHCESMVAPIVWAGIEPIYYRIKEDLTVDLDHLTAIADHKTRILLFPQYFGHQQSTKELYSLAKQNGWTLIEDRAHAFYALRSETPIGEHSDYVVASTSKFFASFDGGVLASRHATETWPPSIGQPLQSQCRAIYDAFDYAAEFGRLPSLLGLIRGPLRSLRRLRDLSPTSGSVPELTSRYGGAEFQGELMNLDATIFAKLLAQHGNRSAIASIRRRNWNEMHGLLKQSPRLRFPVRALGASDVPYVLAVEIPEPNRIFPLIKTLRIPAYRWETVRPGYEESICPVARRFRSSLIQLPCHQNLRPRDIQSIAQALLSVL